MKITAAQYAKTLYELTAEKSKNEIDKVIVNFVNILSKSNQLKNSGKIIANFSDIYNQENGIIEAEIMSARKLESSQVHKVESYLKNKYKVKEVVINNRIDEKIKGGIVIKVSDELLDASVARQLTNLKNKLSA